jgi:mannose-6-phosphate isomerase-like protein (cupin superfamily)
MRSTTPKRSVKPLVLHAAQIANMPPEGFPDPSTGGNVTWKTLMSNERTATDTLTAGIATCPPGKAVACLAASSPSSGSESNSLTPTLSDPRSLGDAGFLKLHRHSHAELYHVISGTGVVRIDQQEYEVNKGSVVFIPGDAEHGIFNKGNEDLVWLYVFAASGFDQIVYRFSDEEGDSGANVKAKL